MELKGKLVNITRHLGSGQFWITLGVEAIPEGLASLQEKILAITLKQYREKRSLNANAYYWRLVGEMAAYMKHPQQVVHNELLRSYGTLDTVEGENLMIFIPDTIEAEEKVLMQETYHLKPTSMTKITDDGRAFRAYLVIKGSHEYDTQEMSRLIDGAVSEAKQMGIETLPPEEIERMMRAYEGNMERHKRI